MSLPSEEKERVRYLVVGLPRSGTTVIHTGIMGHPHVSALTDEMLVLPFFAKGLASFTYGKEYPEEREHGHRALFDAMTSIFAKEHTVAFGAKCCAQTVGQAEVLVESLREHFPGMKVVLNVRNDLVAQYGSLLSARFNGVWHSWNKGAQEVKNRRWRLYGPLFDRYALRSLETMRVLRRLHESHEVFECVYEDLLSDPMAVFESIFKFLGLPAVGVTWLKAQKVKAAPRDYIVNYDRMAQRLERLRQMHERGAVPLHTRATVRALEAASGFVYRRVLGHGY
jgi:LPS sulfotransferase NodH